MRMHFRMKPRTELDGTPLEDEGEIKQFADAREATFNFEKGVITLRWRDNSGEHISHYEMQLVENMDWNEDPSLITV
jgi:hypothetical protein